MEPGSIRSDYFYQLDSEARTRYNSKLTLAEGQIPLPDPYGLKDGWVNDPRKWPAITYIDIYQYLIESPGPTFTRETMRSYRSLEAYNYFVSGHVQTCWFHPITPETPVCFIKAKVTPSQRITEQPHEGWVCFHKTKCYVITAHCTCMAGLGESCSHIAAIMFKAESAQRLLQEEAPTSRLCVWNQCSKKQVIHVPVRDMDFSHPRHERETKNRKKCQKLVPRMSTAEQEQSLSELKKLLPTAAVLTKGNSDTDTASEDESSDESLPPLLQTIFLAEHRALSSTDLAFKVQEVKKKYQVSSDQVKALSTRTVGQSESPLWHAHRAGRITSTTVHSIKTMRCTTSPVSTLEDVMKYNPINLTNIPACQWGISKESEAREDYVTYHSNKHKNFSCKESGLVILPDMPFAGASPDGLIECDCHGKGVLEIKCPFKYRHSSPTDEMALSDPHYCLSSNLLLKTTHKYYTQIQFQMFICQREYCHFVVWTTEGFLVLLIHKDQQFCSELSQKVSDFVDNHLLPELLTRRLETQSESTVALPDQDTRYCSCNRPPYGRMLQCSNPDCTTVWFHYCCVGLKRKPKNLWLCQDCMH